VKSSDFLINRLNLASQYATPQLRSLVELQQDQPEFNTFEDVLSLFPTNFPLPKVIQGILISHNY
jgi:hypothetical protein